MLKLNKDAHREPIGGHQFKVEDGPLITGESFEEVVSSLKDFRIRNNLPVGNPEQEVLGFYAFNWPHLVKEDRDAPIPKPLDPNYVAWREWIYRAWKNPPRKPVSTNEAATRWEICGECPFNRPKDWKKSEESEELARRAYMLRRGIDVPSFLGYCSCHKADLGVFTFLDESYSAKKDGGYAKCWVK